MGKKYMEVHYLHRDEGNYKVHDSKLFTNRKKLSTSQIKNALKENSLDKDGAFYPLEVGLCVLYGSDHDSHEITDVVEIDLDEAISEEIDVLRLISLFKKMSKRHNRAGRNKSVIPSTSNLLKDVMTVLNELWRVLFSYRGRVVLVAIHLDDFATIEETLEIGSQSSAFEPDIRENLTRGLKRMKEIDIKPVFELRKRLMQVEKELPK